MKSRNDISIYSFYYKDTIIPIENELYLPVMAGHALYRGKSGMTGDDTGNSISEKNRQYSELTGIYWVWKNTHQKITGCCHYRRYFCTRESIPFDYKLRRVLFFLARLYKKRYGLIYTSNINRFRKKIIGKNEIMEIFKSHDAILPVKRRFRYTVERHYQRYHNSTDMGIIHHILGKIYPEYLPAFNKMLNGNTLYANNMFIMKSPHYDRFMEWWFNILFEFERNINPENYSGYQQRVIGFIAERLLTTWFLHEKLSVKELPVIYFKKLKYNR